MTSKDSRAKDASVSDDPYRPPTETQSQPATAPSSMSLLPASSVATLWWALAVFPVLGVVDMFVDRFTGVVGWPNDLPMPFLLIGFAACSALWVRAFRLGERRYKSLSPTAYALLTLPICLAVSAVLTLPILLVGWYFATRAYF